MRVRRILVICSGNTCRSPMAAALLRHIWQQDPAWELEVQSAGTSAFPGMAATDHAVKVMAKRGLDLASHRSQPVTDQVLRNVDLVLTMTGRHKDYLLMLWPELRGKVHTLGEFTGTSRDVLDPFGGSLDQYEATAAELESILESAAERIRNEGSPKE